MLCCFSSPLFRAEACRRQVCGEILSTWPHSTPRRTHKVSGLETGCLLLWVPQRERVNVISRLMKHFDVALTSVCSLPDSLTFLSPSCVYKRGKKESTTLSLQADFLKAVLWSVWACSLLLSHFSLFCLSHPKAVLGNGSLLWSQGVNSEFLSVASVAEWLWTVRFFESVAEPCPCCVASRLLNPPALLFIAVSMWLQHLLCQGCFEDKRWYTQGAWSPVSGKCKW